MQTPLMKNMFGLQSVVESIMCMCVRCMFTIRIMDHKGPYGGKGELTFEGADLCWVRAGISLRALTLIKRRARSSNVLGSGHPRQTLPIEFQPQTFLERSL